MVTYLSPKRPANLVRSFRLKYITLISMSRIPKMLCALQSAVSNEENVDNDEIRGWSDKEVEALIETWKKHCLKFESPKYT
ncbi:unnamed protein product, partial [Tenebrio molitor]